MSRKLILHSLAVLGVNVVVGFLAGSAFLLFIFKGDPILAAVPALLALPGILLQPWFVLFFFLPGGPLLAPVLTTAVTLPVYGWLNRRGKLERAKLVLARVGKRRAIAITLPVVLCVLAAGLARYVDFPPLNHGVPPALGRFVGDGDFVLDKPRYYCLGSFIDSEWLWQARLSEADVNRLAEKLGLRPLDAKQIGASFFKMPPYWWHPAISDRTRVLATPNFPMEDNRGQDGWHALATWDPEDKVLHMWIKDNF